MTELHEALPLWVEIGALTGLPLLWILGAIAAPWLLSRRMPEVASLHWTERARHLTQDTGALSLLSLTLSGLAFATLIVVMRGVLAPGDAIGRALVVVLVMFMAGRFFFRRRLLSYKPRKTLSDRWNDLQLGLVQGSPVLLITALMACFGPAHFGWQALAVYGTGCVLSMWLLLGGGFSIAQALGSSQEPDDRLTRLIDRVAQRSGHRPQTVRVSRSTTAQAFALPWRNTLLFTTRLLEVLDDGQVEAIAAHEVGHLRESHQSRLGRLGGLPILLVIGAWRLAVEGVGWMGFVVLLALGMLATLRTLAKSRALESAADEHALEYGSAADSEQQEDRVHAMALERLHEANLSPVTSSSKLSTHPDLYDRMLACGLQPNYSRPDPPLVELRAIQLLSLVIAVPLILTGLASFVLSGVADLSPNAASWAIVLRGGQPADIAALGHWLEDTDPERANILVEFAERHADEQSSAPSLLRPLIEDLVHSFRHIKRDD